VDRRTDTLPEVKGHYSAKLVGQQTCSETNRATMRDRLLTVNDKIDIEYGPFTFNAIKHLQTT